MIDFHTHILPGIDDGLDTEDEAVPFAQAAYEDGTRTMVATPHCKEGVYENDLEDVLASTRALEARLQAEGVGLRLVPGAEVHICPDLVERVRDGRAPTLGDNKRTLLLELSLSQYPVELEEIVFQLKLAGIEPVFAHPERIRFFQDDPLRYEAVVRLGAHGQVTTGSILGRFGNTAREYSEELVRKGLVHVLASDAHNLRGRPPLLTPAIEAIVPWVGEARAQGMVNEIPRALLDGETPELPPIDDSAVRGSFLSRWFRRR